jgi:hypothetical protein
MDTRMRRAQLELAHDAHESSIAASHTRACLQAISDAHSRWISDRSGHLTPSMLKRYDRAARSLTDLQIVPPDISDAIPELRNVRALPGLSLKP